MIEATWAKLASERAEILRGLHAYADKAFVPIMEDDSAGLLANCVAEVRPSRILEIGTAIGYSGLLMLSVAEGATLTTIDIDEARVDVARCAFEAAGEMQNVHIILDDAAYVLPMLEKPFDFILLDGPKGQYQAMLPDLLRLLTPEGMIFVDDTAYLGLVDNGEYPVHKHRTIVVNMRKFIQKINEDERLLVKTYATSSGVVTIQKRKELWNC